MEATYDRHTDVAFLCSQRRAPNRNTFFSPTILFMLFFRFMGKQTHIAIRQNRRTTCLSGVRRAQHTIHKLFSVCYCAMVHQTNVQQIHGIYFNEIDLSFPHEFLAIRPS